MTDFAVLIAAYQAAKTLPRAIESVLGQTRLPDEIIVCDDGSTDETSELLTSYGDRLRVVRQENGGLSAARNAAGGQACSDWVVLLDADDEWLPTRLERIAEGVAGSPWADIVTTNAISRWPSRADVPYYPDVVTWVERDAQPTAIVRGSFIFGGAAIRRTALERVGWFRTDVVHQTEWEGFVRLILSGSRAALMDEPLVIYHHDSGQQLSDDKVATIKSRLQVIADEEGRHGPQIDAAIRQSTSAQMRRLPVLEGVAALQKGDRFSCARLAVAPGMTSGLRARLVAATVAPGLSTRWLPKRPAS